MQSVRLGIASPPPLDPLAERLRAVFGVDFERRSSDHWGNPYFRGGLDDQEFMLIENRDPMYRVGDPPEDYWFEAEAADCAALLDVSAEVVDAATLRERVTSALGVECRIISS
jgi:hypothetical protein